MPKNYVSGNDGQNWDPLGIFNVFDNVTEESTIDNSNGVESAVIAKNCAAGLVLVITFLTRSLQI